MNDISEATQELFAAAYGRIGLYAQFRGNAAEHAGMILRIIPSERADCTAVSLVLTQGRDPRQSCAIIGIRKLDDGAGYECQRMVLPDRAPEGFDLAGMDEDAKSNDFEVGLTWMASLSRAFLNWSRRRRAIPAWLHVPELPLSPIPVSASP